MEFIKYYFNLIITWKENDVDHVLHVCLSQSIHKVAEVVIQTSKSLLNLNRERAELFGLGSQTVFVNLENVLRLGKIHPTV